jgi:hypothetical protein
VKVTQVSQVTQGILGDERTQKLTLPRSLRVPFWVVWGSGGPGGPFWVVDLRYIILVLRHLGWDWVVVGCFKSFWAVFGVGGFGGGK